MTRPDDLGGSPAIENQEPLRKLVALGLWVIEAMMSNNTSDEWFYARDKFRLEARKVADGWKRP